MAKSSREQIEADEIKILKELRKNSRLSYNDLAEKCGFSRQKVWRIVNNLEKNKTIWGYSTVLDDEKLSLKQFFILFKIRGAKSPDSQVAIAIDENLKENFEKRGLDIEGSYYTHGSSDWLIVVNAKNIIEISKFIESIRNDYYEYITDIQTLEIMFPIIKEGIVNPENEKLKEFFLNK